MAKCQILSSLDSLNKNNLNFKELEGKTQRIINKFTNNLEDRFKFTLNINNYG